MMTARKWLAPAMLSLAIGGIALGYPAESPVGDIQDSNPSAISIVPPNKLCTDAAQDNCVYSSDPNTMVLEVDGATVISLNEDDAVLGSGGRLYVNGKTGSNDDYIHAGDVNSIQFVINDSITSFTVASNLITIGSSINMRFLGGRIELNSGKAELASVNDCQVEMSNAANTVGGVLDVCTADTFTVYAKDGSSAGALKVTGARYTNVTVIDVDSSPYSLLASDEVIVCDSDAGSGAPAAVTINLPASSASTVGRILKFKNVGGTSNCTVDANGTDEIDNDGAAGVAVTPGSSLTLVNTNETDYHWMIE